MVLGGVQKNSFIDYPGRISCVLFFSGCNFDCPYCHNPELVRGASSCLRPLDEDAALSFLSKRRDFLDGVVISGGEPTLNRDLRPFCEKIKAMGYRLKLDTNGSCPKMVDKLLQAGLVDYIAMDIKTDPYKYSRFISKNCSPENILSSIKITMERAPAYEFRTTCVKPIVDEEIIGDISEIIKGAMLYALQDVNQKEVLHPEFFKNGGNGFDYDELMALKSIVEPCVKKCIVR